MKKIAPMISVFVITALIAALGGAGTAQADVYDSYRELKARQDRNEDYRITSYNGPSATAVIAIHGGSIEIGTSQLAKDVAERAGTDLYTFEGIKDSRNRILHITSSRFDEPVAKSLVAKSKHTLSIHGCTGSRPVTYLGGLDKRLAAKIESRLEKAGFKVRRAPSHLNGTHPSNICNENASDQGVQLELSYALRKSFFKNGKTTDTFKRYSAAIASVLKD